MQTLQTSSQRRLMEELKGHMTASGASMRSVARDLGWNPSTLNRQIHGKVGLKANKEAKIREYVSRALAERRHERVAALIKDMDDSRLDLLMHFLQLMQRVG